MSNLPAQQQENAALAAVSDFQPSAFAVPAIFDPKMFEVCQGIAANLSKAKGFIPPHLIGNTEACFAVVTISLDWKLNPFLVAKSTFQTPGGAVGYEGKLCQAILENSGHLIGGVQNEYIGDWSKVQGKFEEKKSQKGSKYPSATYTKADENGLAIIIRAQVKGEDKPREMRMDLTQAYPRNSTLWATDPKTQLHYAAVRRFASVACPGLMMGVPFDDDAYAAENHQGPDKAKDITPQKQGGSMMDQFADSEANDAEAVDDDGVIQDEQTADYEPPAIGVPAGEKGPDWEGFADAFIEAVKAAPSVEAIKEIAAVNKAAKDNCFKQHQPAFKRIYEAMKELGAAQ